MIITMEHFVNFFGAGVDPGEEKTLDVIDRRVLLTMAKYKKPETVVEFGGKSMTLAEQMIDAEKSIMYYLTDPEKVPPTDMFIINGALPFDDVARYTKIARANIEPGGIIMWSGYEHNPRAGASRVIDEINALEGNFIALVAGSRVCFAVKSETRKEQQKGEK